MEFYLFLLVVLFATAIADLYVGVANDAVNFLNSAIGSKAGPRVWIMVVASAGVLIGTTFSTGMMEVARKGIFNPQMFTFHEVMIVLLAVMLTDIILLDLYNTFALPTSTTVSLVFEFIGGTVAMAMIKIAALHGSYADVFDYLNIERVVTIVSSIGVSILFAFVFGVSFQFLTRLLFTFDYERGFRRYGGLYTAAGMTGIVYFILVKGASGSVLIDAQGKEWLHAHMGSVLLGIFLALAVVFQILILFTRVSVLRIAVFFGTFALALAFAANDLVNFIGAPMAALAAFDIATAAGGSPHELTMEGLRAAVHVPPIYLIVAGLVMMSTLWLSGKARSVTQTEISLGRQDDGIERFSSSPISRAVVRIAIGMHDVYARATPPAVQEFVSRRLDPSRAPVYAADDGVPPSFDLLRASVNLMVASALISVGTAFKLPLSTTFVTFMVAMATSLADQAWGRESAVYRVNGVLTVIGGWFVTAALAFATCALFTTIVFHGGLPAILVLMGLGFFFYFRTTRLHRKRAAEFERRQAVVATDGVDEVVKAREEAASFLEDAHATLSLSLDGLREGKQKPLREAVNRARELSSRSEALGTAIVRGVRQEDDPTAGIGSGYAPAIAAIQAITGSLLSLTRANLGYVENHHTPANEEIGKELHDVRNAVEGVLAGAARALRAADFTTGAALREQVATLGHLTRDLDRRELKRIKRGQSRPRLSLLLIGTVSRSERIAQQAVVLFDAHRPAPGGGSPAARDAAAPTSLL